MENLYDVKKHIEKEIAKSRSGMIARILLSRIGIKARFNITQITKATPYNNDTKERLLQSASEIIGRDISGTTL